MSNNSSAQPFEAFKAAYIEAILTYSWDQDEQKPKLSDLAPGSLEAIHEDCWSFFVENGDLLRKAAQVYGINQAGYDFYHTRCQSGCGYWDGDLPEPLGDKLTEHSKAYDPLEGYWGDDQFFYV